MDIPRSKHFLLKGSSQPSELFVYGSGIFTGLLDWQKSPLRTSKFIPAGTADLTRLCLTQSLAEPHIGLFSQLTVSTGLFPINIRLMPLPAAWQPAP